MESEHIKAGLNKAAGKVKEGLGKMTDDASLQAKGHMQQAKAKGQDMVGDVKDALE